MFHPDTGVPYRACDAAYAAIVQLVTSCRATYTADNAKWNESYAEDDAYIAQVLEQFALHRNVDTLIQAVAQQDSYVRDYYADIVNDLYSMYFGGEWQ